MIIATISIGRSVDYTIPALASLFRHTSLMPSDEVLLTVNDLGGEPDLDALGTHRSRVEVIRNPAPLGFAANANQVLRRAADARTGLVLLNNDVVLTPGWLEPLVSDPHAVTLPTSNQTVGYARDGLSLAPSMTLADLGGRTDALDAISRDHAARHLHIPFHRSLLMPYFAVHVPHDVNATVGGFDEGYGQGGGEDVDHRLRALLAGFDVRSAWSSYVLHFNGRSTWRSGEHEAQTAARVAAYRRRFADVWGALAASVFLGGGSEALHGAPDDVRRAVKAGDYAEAVKACTRAGPPVRR